MSIPFALQLPRQLYTAILAQARAALPNECCGLLAGAQLPQAEAIARVVVRYPLENAATSPVLYEAHPRDLLAAFKDMRRRGLDLLAIYHSHPTSDPIPSKTDLARNHYGSEVVHLILSLKDSQPRLRAWRLDETDAVEVAWEEVLP